MVKTLKNILIEASGLNDYLSSRGINPKFVSRDTKISHAKSALFQKWKSDRKLAEETILESSETALLVKYLNSRGINAKYATKDMKISHSKSGEFMKWKRDHQHLELAEETDAVDTITVDIPLMIRLLELAREDVKDDMELHKITERLIEIRSKGTLSMEDYDFIANGKAKIKEEVLDESPKEGGKRKFSGMYNPAPKGTFAYDQAMRKKKHDEIEKNQSKDGSGMTSAIDRLQKHMNNENTLDSLAATEAPCDNSDMTNGTSKAAKMVKSLKKTVKEETYDWEKDDKSSMQKPYGKAPKINVTDKSGTLGDTKPEARVVMKGGKTLTGQTRDMVEIDPSVQQRPGQDKGQSTFTSPIAKKSP
jgi:hypothetical protein